MFLSVCFCLHGPFNCFSFHKFSQQLSAFSLCFSGLIFALLVISTIISMKVSLSSYIILCGWLGLKHQLTNLPGSFNFIFSILFLHSDICPGYWICLSGNSLKRFQGHTPNILWHYSMHPVIITSSVKRKNIVILFMWICTEMLLMADYE